MSATDAGTPITDANAFNPARADDPGGEVVDADIARDLERRLAAAEAEKDAFKKECNLLTHKVITCGVAAEHPNGNLSKTGAYAAKWNSPQAEAVRKLRDRADAAESALRTPAPSAQEEWRTVPVEPTENILQAACKWRDELQVTDSIPSMFDQYRALYKAMLAAAAPSAPTVAVGWKPEAADLLCRADGRCQYAIDHGAEGMGHCPAGQCCTPRIAHYVEVGREWAENSSLEKWFPFTAEELAKLREEVRLLHETNRCAQVKRSEAEGALLNACVARSEAEMRALLLEQQIEFAKRDLYSAIAQMASTDDQLICFLVKSAFTSLGGKI